MSAAVVVAQKRVFAARKGMKSAAAKQPPAQKKKKVVREQRIVARETYEKAIKNRQDAECKLIGVLNKEYNKEQRNKFISHEFITALSRVYKVIRDKMDVKDTFIFAEDADDLFRITLKNKTDTVTLVGKIAEQGGFHLHVQEHELKSVDGMKCFMSFVQKACGQTHDTEFVPEQLVMLYHATWSAIFDDVCGRATFLAQAFPELPICDARLLKQYMMEAL